MLTKPAVLIWGLLCGNPEGPDSANPAVRHPGSISRAEIRIDGNTLEFALTPQALTFVEVPDLGLDRNHDRIVSTTEWAQGWEAVNLYLQSGLRFVVDGEEWNPRFTEYELFDAAGQIWTQPLEDIERIRCISKFESSAPIEKVEFDFQLFFEDGNPDHRVFLNATGLSSEPLEILLGRDYRQQIYPIPQPGAFEQLTRYVGLGFDHVLEGYDHLAFLLALLFGISGWATLAWTVSAFTLAHSVTLALSALDVFSLPAAIVEPCISVSILFALWWHLYRGHQAAKAWQVALLFGLLHGFGFAGVLGEIGLPDGARFVALLGFNLGVEAGQLIFIVPVALVAGWIGKRLSPTAGAETLAAAAAGLSCFGLYLSSQAIYANAGWTYGISWPPELPAVPIALGLTGILALILKGKSHPNGRPLFPTLVFSLLLYLLFVAGRSIGHFY